MMVGGQPGAPLGAVSVAQTRPITRASRIQAPLLRGSRSAGPGQQGAPGQPVTRRPSLPLWAGAAHAHLDWFSWAGGDWPGGPAVGRGAGLPLLAPGLSLPACGLETWVQLSGAQGRPHPLRAFVSLSAKWDQGGATRDEGTAVCARLPPASGVCGHVGISEKLWEAWMSSGSTGSRVGAEDVMCCLAHVCTAVCLSVFLGCHTNPLTGACE